MYQRTLRLATLLSMLCGSTLVLIALPSATPQTLSGAVMSNEVPHMLRAANLIRRRAYGTVQAECQRRFAAGEEIDCPDINVPSAMRDFMSSDQSGALMKEHPAAASLSITDLDDFQRGLLRWYKRSGVCPETIDSIVPGFYALCVSLVGDQGQNGGMQQILKQLTPPPIAPQASWSLDEFIKMNARTRGN